MSNISYAVASQNIKRKQSKGEISSEEALAQHISAAITTFAKNETSDKSRKQTISMASTVLKPEIQALTKTIINSFSGEHHDTGKKFLSGLIDEVLKREKERWKTVHNYLSHVKSMV